jgi:hypothetical protein
VNDELLNLGKKWALPFPGLCLEEVGKTMKPTIRIGSFVVEAATRESPNTITEINVQQV